MNAPESTGNLRNLVDQLSRLLVDHPDQVVVDEFDERGTTIFELEVAPEDIGQIIGKQGRTVRSLRAVLSAAASRMGKRAELDVIEND